MAIQRRRGGSQGPHIFVMRKKHEVPVLESSDPYIRFKGPHFKVCFRGSGSIKMDDLVGRQGEFRTIDCRIDVIHTIRPGEEQEIPGIIRFRNGFDAAIGIAELDEDATGDGVSFKDLG